MNPGARLHRHGETADQRLADFCDFCRVDLGLSDKTARDYRRKVRRFLAALGRGNLWEETTVEDVRDWLRPLADGTPNTYGNVLKLLKAFLRDFMRMPETVATFAFKKAPLTPVIVPSKEQLQKFYTALRKPISRALFLMYASYGPRKMALLSLSKDDVDWEKRDDDSEEPWWRDQEIVGRPSSRMRLKER